jgi:hypothetical protein
VSSRHVEVVWLDRNRGEDVLDERVPSLLALALRKLDADQQLGGRDRCDCRIVLVIDDLVERRYRALRCDENRCVEYQPFQVRSSTVRAARRSLSSDAQPSSGGFERSKSLTSLPLAARAG